MSIETTTSQPAMCDSINASRAADSSRHVIFTREFCESDTCDDIPPPPPLPKLRRRMAVPLVNSTSEFISILETLYFVDSVHEVDSHTLVIWTHSNEEDSQDSQDSAPYIGLYKEHGEPSVATTTQRVDEIMTSGVCDMLFNISRIERIHADHPSGRIPYIITIRHT